MRGDRLVALFLFGATVFSPPLIRVFGAPDLVFGIPLPHLWLFGTWAVLIALVAAVVETRGRGR
ncbi:MAG TPA: hypothetical protein VK943_16750 [Arenibaculum sp.]|nr:hypothetical protein [Arenibaculum sp.]